MWIFDILGKIVAVVLCFYLLLFAARGLGIYDPLGVLPARMSYSTVAPSTSTSGMHLESKADCEAVGGVRTINPVTQKPSCFVPNK